jgi:DNA invertase Pin-like site-specific DNA recombinase
VLERDLAAIGRRRARAKGNLERLTEEAKEAAREAADEGVSESELARLLQVDRMTIRTWLGKKRRSPEIRGGETVEGGGEPLP